MSLASPEVLWTREMHIGPPAPSNHNMLFECLHLSSMTSPALSHLTKVLDASALLPDWWLPDPVVLAVPMSK